VTGLDPSAAPGCSGSSSPPSPATTSPSSANLSPSPRRCPRDARPAVPSSPRRNRPAPRSGDSPGRSRHDVDETHLLVEDGAGHLTRLAGAFSSPPDVRWVRGRELHAVDPEPAPVPAPPPSAALAFAPQLEAAGCDVRPRARRRRRRGPRARGRPRRGAADGPPRLEVGVGRHDREAFAIIHGDLPDRRGTARRRRRRCGSIGGPMRPSIRCTGWRRSGGCAKSCSPIRASSARRRSTRPTAPCRVPT
jgi:hypothetical protein